MSKRKREILKISERGVLTQEAMVAYLRDELGVDQKKEFEKLLKEDPFAQDALDGFREKADYAAAATVIAGINEQVRERVGVKEGKVIKMNWQAYAMAAAVLGLLVAVGFLLVNFIGGKNESGALAQDDKSVMEQKVEEPSLISAGSASDSSGAG